MTFMHDRRAEPRFETRVRAVLFAAATNARFEGTIKNLSDSGACVETDAGYDAMLSFLEPGARFRIVLMEAGAVYECQLRWRQSRSLGLQFIDLAPRSTRIAVIARLRAEQPRA